MAGLRVATWPLHQRLEKRLDVKHRFSTLASYREHLEKMYGFCAGLERSVEFAGIHGALADFASRSKLLLLRRDLIALGLTDRSVGDLPSCDSLRACDEPATAFGRLYVIEGATLGGRTLLPLISSRLGLSADHGAAFFASYGDAVEIMWCRFGKALDAWCAPSDRSASAASAALTTFEALEAWLCGAQA
jgi:heme oxygenase